MLQTVPLASGVAESFAWAAIQFIGKSQNLLWRKLLHGDAPLWNKTPQQTAVAFIYGLFPMISTDVQSHCRVFCVTLSLVIPEQNMHSRVANAGIQKPVVLSDHLNCERHWNIG